MKTLSTDFRLKILAAYDAGLGTRQQIAERFMVSLGMVKKLIQQRRHTGDIAPLHHRAGRPRKLAGKGDARLSELVGKRPDATLEQLREGLPIKCGISTIHRALRRLGLTFKKRPSGPASRIARMSGAGAKSGVKARPSSTRAGSSSSTRRARRRT